MNYKDVFILYIYYAIIFIIFLYTILHSSISYINSNWNKYKCNPIIMPMAGYIKYNIDNPTDFTEKNFEDCTTNTLLELSESSINLSLNPALDSFNNTLFTMNDSINSVYLLVLQRFRMMVQSTLQTLGGQFNIINQSIGSLGLRTKIMVKRLASVIITIAYSFASIIKTQEAAFNYGKKIAKIISIAGLFIPGVNVALIGPIKKSGILGSKKKGKKGLFNFCFHPSSYINLANDKQILAKYIRPGHMLEHMGYVTYTFKLKNIYKDFVKLKNIILTEDHKVYNEKNKKYMKSKYHPLSKKIHPDNTDYIVCWNTLTGNFIQNNILYQDYEGKCQNNNEGLCGNIMIPCINSNNKYKKIKDIYIDDLIGYNNAKVYGIVIHKCSSNKIRTLKINNYKYQCGKDTIIKNINNEHVILEDDWKGYNSDIEYNINIDKPTYYLYSFITDKEHIQISQDLYLTDYDNS